MQEAGSASLQKPVLRASASLIPTQADTLMVKDGKKIYHLKGGVVPLLQRLLPLLDGQRDTATLCRLLPDYQAADIGKVLHALRSRGLIEDAAVPPSTVLSADEIARYQSQIAFFQQYALDPYEAQAALKTANVAVVGLGDIGTRVLTSLALAGVGEIAVLDPRPVAEADVFAGALYREADLRQSRVSAAQQQAEALNPHVRVSPVETALKTVEEARALVRDRDVVAVCLDGFAPGVLKLINEACLAEDVVWTSAHFEDDDGVLGPSVIPSVTPCYQCYDLRLKANLRRYDEYVAYERHLIETGSGLAVSSPALAPAAAVMAGHVALEAIKLLTKVTDPALLGRIYVTNFLTLEAESHEILKLPRCPACSPTRHVPPYKAWEV